MDCRHHLKIGGQGFLVSPGSYRRTAVARMDGREGAASGRERLCQRDWSGGDGRLVWGEEGSSGRWHSGYSVEPLAGGVRLGPAMPRSFLSTEDSFAAMLPFSGKLFAASASSGAIYCYDGSVWDLACDTGKLSVASLAVHQGWLYAGSGSDGVVFRSDGLSWDTLFQLDGASSIQAMFSYEEWDETAGAVTPRLILGCGFSGGEARVYRWDGAAPANLHGCREPRVEAMAAYRDRLYVATSDAGEGAQGRLLCYDGRSGTGRWSEVAWLRDNYVASLAIFDEMLICGSGTGGWIWAFDGNRLHEVYSVAGAAGYEDPVRALGVSGGRLYAGYLHPSQGMVLLSKLPAAEVVGSGDAEGVESARLGWFTPSVVGGSQCPSTLAGYGGSVYLGGESPGGAAIYWQDSAGRQGAGLLESCFFDGGLPAVPKLLHSLVVSHQPLQSGQRLEVSYALSDEDGFREADCSGLYWVALGQADVVGATSAAFAFPGDVSARRVSFRVRLVGAGSGDSPVLAGLLLEYGFLPEVRRRWSFDVICEGVAGAPMRLLDGALEERAGNELSGLIWEARRTGATSFDDLDEATYQVWFESLEERLSDAPQDRGIQTIISCRLVEY